MAYQPPTVTDLGTARDLTQQRFNKVGSNPDVDSNNPNVVGSLVPID